MASFAFADLAQFLQASLAATAAGQLSGNPLLAVGVTVGAVVLAIVVGGLVRKVGWLTESADATLLNLLVRVFIPALILQRVLGNNALRDLNNLIVPPVLAFLLVTGGFVVAALALRLVGKSIAGMDDPRKRRTFALSAGMFNYGYVTLPLTESLYPAETLGVLFVFNVGVEAAMWGVGVTLITGGFSRGADNHRPSLRVMLGRLFSPPVIATIVAVTLNALSLPIPTAAQPVVDLAGKSLGWLADAAIPIGLLLTGATIWHDWGEAKLKTGLPVVVLAASVRLVALPAIFLALAMAMPESWASVHLRRVLVLQAAMPSAVFPIVLSRHYGGDVGTALRIVVGTSLISLITMPAWIALGQWLVL